MASSPLACTDCPAAAGDECEPYCAATVGLDDEPAAVEVMHRSPVTGCPHYGTPADCTISACKLARARADRAMIALIDTVQGAAPHGLTRGDVDAIVAIARDTAEQTPVVKIARVLDPNATYPSDDLMAQAGHVWGATRTHLAMIAEEA